MFSYIWPIGLVVLSNVIYQICAKSVPFGMDPFAALTVTYIVAAIFSAVMFFAFNKHGNLIAEYSKMNWAPIILGVVIIGLEVGNIFVYQAGWQISVASTVQSAFMAVALLVVGWLIYSETISWNKIVGIVAVIVGLFFINYKK